MLDEATALMFIGTEAPLSWRRNESIVRVSCTHFGQILAKTKQCASGHATNKKSNYYKHIYVNFQSMDVKRGILKSQITLMAAIH